MSCIQKGGGSEGYQWASLMDKLGDEISEELPLFGSIIGILMLIQLKNMLNGHHQLKYD